MAEKDEERKRVVRGWRGRKTTATELCRGFNQPNYSLITETQNLEQLTCSHTHTKSHILSYTHAHTHATAHKSPQ